MKFQFLEIMRAGISNHWKKSLRVGLWDSSHDAREDGLAMAKEMSGGSDGGRDVVLLTGASGYIGGRLLKALEDRGRSVRCMARRSVAGRCARLLAR
jgi:hypothetical protein